MHYTGAGPQIHTDKHELRAAERFDPQNKLAFQNNWL